MSDKQYWILKTEPDVYAFADLQEDGVTMWDGVANNAALKNIRTMKPGDLALIYHTGNERRIVGFAEIVSEPYPDPDADNPKMVVVDIKVLQPITNFVSLAAIKADPVFAEFALVRQSRLSVVPVPTDLWHTILRMGGETT
ncbi:MAG: EVE domain-containing protein [Chloroflexi bacterium AL-W]|nr:EVE domain-containing protein [Chloroflexi bacterium AL-N1]NOK65093.1 EVE domain-containing protein [Chloroflexi bacterium AL-N10]NOK72640.1 EVE domain-containing protein [Chloroflexi bacterium AL-N5]NOK79272.1 EVE domain-containing protein [Chloroflexi bacterium AL-W]NOK87188.1 EVE domain-containing protein [Chloroflexi bacterium AL-N15]